MLLYSMTIIELELLYKFARSIHVVIFCIEATKKSFVGGMLILPIGDTTTPKALHRNNTITIVVSLEF